MQLKKLLTIFAVALGTTLSAAAGAKELKVGLIVPATHEWTKAAAAMGEELKQKSNGKYSVATFPAGQLGSEAQMMQQLQTGALDMAFMTVAEVTNRVPDMSVLFAPYLVKDYRQAEILLNGPTAQKMLERLPREVGAVGLGYGVASMRLMLNAFPTNSGADLKGRKMRITPFPPVRDFYQLLGAASTPMPLTDVYDSLANGQVDGVDADAELVWRMKFFERGNTLVHSSHMMFPVVGLISGRLWQQLTPADRELIATSARKHLNSLFSTYTSVEAEMLKNIEGTKKIKVVKAGPEFFGDVPQKWEEIWLKRAPVLADLRKEVAAIK
ncbi:TRAP dicarboxylate transporter- DctP subunit [Acidovorax sp. NO-1]|uniref:TRAP transporter substrate-binding protein n=1 Tax=unclassified Acidovorax TaxID=2684926 RepID=UPI00023FD24C|nr:MULTISPECIES: TRAP transporter substrate-binding protein [unclassified Acidovorax]AFU47935.1 TRAP dicarboxylate transporter- DctP subunit [Acidovorax sp. KKS102]EHL23203.1 TRAP dicarboxylate transporter- DctP subunit [Acidovorax sp. NO-1]